MPMNLELIFNDTENNVLFFSEKVNDGYKGIYSFRYDTAEGQTCLDEYSSEIIHSFDKRYVRKKIIDFCYYPYTECD